MASPRRLATERTVILGCCALWSGSAIESVTTTCSSGDRSRALDAAGVRGDDGEVLEPSPVDPIEQDRCREEVVDRQVEETLDRRCVQVHREEAVDARRGEEVGDDLRRDRHARLVLAI